MTAETMHDFTHPQLAIVLPQPPPPALLDALGGFGSDVEVVEGAEGITHFDPDGREHGGLARVKRLVQEESRPISRMTDLLEQGHSIVVVHDVDDDDVAGLVEVLADTDVEVMYQFSELTWQRLGG